MEKVMLCESIKGIEEAEKLEYQTSIKPLENVKSNFIIQLKYDGTRAIAVKENNEIKIRLHSLINSEFWRTSSRSKSGKWVSWPESIKESIF